MKLSEAKEKHCMCIYKLTFPDGKSYVGKTKSLSGRISIYEKFYKEKNDGILSDAIREFGLDNIELSIVAEPKNIKDCDKELILSVLEIKYIREYNTLTPNGYNVSSGGEVLNIPLEYLPTCDYGCKSILVYDTDGSFVKEFESINKCAYDYGINSDDVRLYLDKRKAFMGKYIFRTKKYNYIPEKIDTTTIKVKERVRYKNIVVKNLIEKDVFIGRPIKALVYDMNGDFVGEFNSKTEAIRSFSKSNSFPFGVYRDGYIVYKKVSDDYPKKIEPYVETLDYILSDEYKPLSECQKIERPIRDISSIIERNSINKSDCCKGFGLHGKHKNLINNFKVRQYDDNGFEKIYGNMRDASNESGIPYANIWACVMGKTKKCRGYKWEKYEGDK